MSLAKRIPNPPVGASMRTCSLGAPPAAWQGPQFEDQINPKIRPVMGAAAARFRLIVDD